MKLKFRIDMKSAPGIAAGLIVKNAAGEELCSTSGATLVDLGGGWFSSTADIESTYYSVHLESDDSTVIGLEGKSHVVLDPTGTVKNTDGVVAQVATTYSAKPGNGKYVGQMVFDSVGKKPVWWNGTGWQLADGSAYWNK